MPTRKAASSKGTSGKISQATSKISRATTKKSTRSYHEIRNLQEHAARRIHYERCVSTAFATMRKKWACHTLDYDDLIHPDNYQYLFNHFDYTDRKYVQVKYLKIKNVADFSPEIFEDMAKLAEAGAYKTIVKVYVEQAIARCRSGKGPNKKLHDRLGVDPVDTLCALMRFEQEQAKDADGTQAKKAAKALRSERLVEWSDRQESKIRELYHFRGKKLRA